MVLIVEMILVSFILRKHIHLGTLILVAKYFLFS